MDSKRVILAGGSGFLGRSLAARLLDRGLEPVILTRSPKSGSDPVREAAWDGKTVGEWAKLVDGALAVVNLTGRNVNCRYTPENRREIVESRVDSVRAVGEAIRRSARPPAAWVQAGSLAIYGDPGDRLCDESAPHGKGFSVEVCEAWEDALNASETPGTRKTVLRIGIVLGPDGAMEIWNRLVRLGLGGAAGSGRQYVSWLHLDDLIRIVEWILDRPEAEGIYNTTAPEPVPNAELMAALRRAHGRPWSPPVPAWAVRIGAQLMGTEGELALSGRRCIPRRLTEDGFEFRYSKLNDALKDLLKGR